MNNKKRENAKLIWGTNLIIFGIVLSCHIFIDKFNFNDFWCLFIVVPTLVDIVLNKKNIFNLSLFITSSSVFGYFLFNNLWACFIIAVILVGLLLVFGKYLPSEPVAEEDNKKDAFTK